MTVKGLTLVYIIINVHLFLSCNCHMYFAVFLRSVYVLNIYQMLNWYSSDV